MWRGSNSDARAGMNVRARTSAPASANNTVIAIGTNIFPSMPVSERIGRYTMAMIATPKASERVRAFRDHANGVFDDDHRAIDDESKVDRAERHEVAGYVEPPHPDERDEHRQRNGGGDDQPRAQVSQHQEEDDDDQEPSLE